MKPQTSIDDREARGLPVARRARARPGRRRARPRHIAASSCSLFRLKRLLPTFVTGRPPLCLSDSRDQGVEQCSARIGRHFVERAARRQAKRSIPTAPVCPPEPLSLLRRRLRLAHVLRVRSHRRRPPPRGVAAACRDSFGYMLARARRTGRRLQGARLLGRSTPRRRRASGPPRCSTAPRSGLRRASAGEICIAAAAQLDGSTREPPMFLRPAARESDEEAAQIWRRGRGGRRPDGALRPRLHAARPRRSARRVQAPADLHGDREVQPVGVELPRPGGGGDGRHVTEAERCYRRAIELEALQDEQTDAEERLAELRRAL